MEHYIQRKQREYNNECLKKMYTPLDIPKKLKQTEIKMINLISLFNE